MKFSKVLSWIGQCIAYIVQLITNTNASVQAVSDQVKSTAEAIASTVTNATAQTTATVSATVAEQGAATIQAVNERAASVSAESQKNFEAVNAKLDNLAITESEDELRKAFESALPKEMLEKFQF